MVKPVEDLQGLGVHVAAANVVLAPGDDTGLEQLRAVEAGDGTRWGDGLVDGWAIVSFDIGMGTVSLPYDKSLMRLEKLKTLLIRCREFKDN